MGGVSVRRRGVAGPERHHPVGHASTKTIGDLSRRTGRPYDRRTSVTMTDSVHTAVAARPQTLASDRLLARLNELRETGLIRLDTEETSALAAALDGIVVDSVDLFGSRVEPGSRGGDIDILVMTTNKPLEISRRISIRFFARCEQKIDVAVMDESQMTPAQKAFVDGTRRVRVA